VLVAIEVAETIFAEAKLFVPDVFEDDRGFFKETWSDPKYAALGLDVRWQQDSCSWSTRGVIRGVHYDVRMAKLVQCLHGRIWDAIVDLRRDSPTYLRWQGFLLSALNHRQLYVPAGFGHGFLALDDDVVVHYKNSVPYDPALEGAVSWRNARIGIAWPLGGAEPRLSAKDASIPADALP
jgi:dTDP-4-dehydrorhamnose 3,5-epimerase